MSLPDESPPPAFLIVDGNNMIHGWPELSSLHRDGKGAAHREFIKLLEAYQNLGKYRVVVVFDGRGPSTSEIREAGSVQVFFSSSDTPADFLIERLTAAYASQYRIVVATDDGAVQNAVIGAGGEVISSRAFRREIQSVNSALNRWIRNK